MQTSTTADFYLKYLLDAPAVTVADSQPLAILENEVHVWNINLARVPVLDEALSRAEHERAARFDSEKDRQRFKAAHSALRTILGRYLKLAPSLLVFGQTDFGKPFVVNSEGNGLLFNLSQSGEVAVIAVGRDRELGIDVKAVRPDFSIDRAAECFSVAEMYTLSGLNPELRARAFFDCLTRKQAYVKARGEGLSIPLDQFDVSLAPLVPAAMLANRVDANETSRWVFHDLQVAPDYSGALVIEALGTPPQLSCFTLS